MEIREIEVGKKGVTVNNMKREITETGITIHLTMREDKKYIYV